MTESFAPEFDYNGWEPLIKQVASRVSADFPDTDYDDMIQDLWLFVLEKRKYLSSPDQPGAPTAVWKRAKQYAWEQRKQYLTVSVQYSYRPSDVRRILETLFNHGDWPHAFVPEDAKSIRGNDHVEISSDVAWAFKKLRGPYQEIILRRFRDGDIFGAGAEGMRLSRAIDSLTDILNFYSRGDYRRKAVTNTQARYIISNQGDC